MTTQDNHVAALRGALDAAANYIDALGGDSRSYRQTLTQPSAPEQASRPSKDACDEGPCPDPELCESEQYCCFRATPAAPVAAKPETKFTQPSDDEIWGGDDMMGSSS